MMSATLVRLGQETGQVSNAPDLTPPGGLQSLLMSARAGDATSLGQLLAHYRAYLLWLGSNQFRQQLRPRVSPSDVVQETMLRAHRHFGQFRGQTEAEFMAWLREILVNSLARFVEQHVRAAKRDIRREVSWDQCGAAANESESLAAGSNHRDVKFADTEHVTLLRRLLDQLPEHYRQVLILRNLQGLSFEEVAARLDRAPGAARMLWLRAIEKLRAIHRSKQDA